MVLPVSLCCIPWRCALLCRCAPRQVIACLDVRGNDRGDLVVTKGDQYDVREQTGGREVREGGREVREGGRVVVAAVCEREKLRALEHECSLIAAHRWFASSQRAKRMLA